MRQIYNNNWSSKPGALRALCIGKFASHFISPESASRIRIGKRASNLSIELSDIQWLSHFNASWRAADLVHVQWNYTNERYHTSETITHERENLQRNFVWKLWSPDQLNERAARRLAESKWNHFSVFFALRLHSQGGEHLAQSNFIASNVWIWIYF